MNRILAFDYDSKKIIYVKEIIIYLISSLNKLIKFKNIFMLVFYKKKKIIKKNLKIIFIRMSSKKINLFLNCSKCEQAYNVYEAAQTVPCCSKSLCHECNCLIKKTVKHSI